MPPSISVALATYNGGRFLAEQLQSIAAQSLLPAELVINDDRSTDDTLDVARQFARTAPFPVHVHRNERNLGFIENFRAASLRCAGDLIAFCDQDDWWNPKRLETCVPAFDDPDVLLTYNNAMMVDEGRRPLGLYYDPEAERESLRIKPFAPWKWSNGLLQVFRADLRRFDDLWRESVSHLRDGILAHDRWYFFLAQSLGTVQFVDAVLVEYRQHEANVFGAGPNLVSPKPSLFDRAKHEGGQDLQYAKAAAARARILGKLAARAPDQSTRLLDVAHRYEVLSERNLRRYETYAGSTLPKRLRSLLSSCRAGDYANWPWGFDRRSVVRDLWSGVLLGTV